MAAARGGSLAIRSMASSYTYYCSGILQVRMCVCVWGGGGHNYNDFASVHVCGYKQCSVVGVASVPKVSTRIASVRRTNFYITCHTK